MASYATIIANIDDAINNWVDKPVTVITSEGKTVTYRSLRELIEARKYYAQLAANQANSKPFKTSIIKAGDAR